MQIKTLLIFKNKIKNVPQSAGIPHFRAPCTLSYMNESLEIQQMEQSYIAYKKMTFLLLKKSLNIVHMELGFLQYDFSYDRIHQKLKVFDGWRVQSRSICWIFMQENPANCTIRQTLMKENPTNIKDNPTNCK